MSPRFLFGLLAAAFASAPAHAMSGCLVRDMATLGGPEERLAGVSLGDAREAEPGELTFKSVLGSGGFATVHAGTWTPPGGAARPAIIKRLHQNHATYLMEWQLELEVRAYRALGRQATVLRTGRFVQIVVENPRHDIKTETLRALAVEGPKMLAAVADLSATRLPTLEKLTDASVDAVVELEMRGVINGDVKPANLLVETTADGFHVEVIDFGVSRVAGQPNRYAGHAVGTPIYMGLESATGGSDFTARRHADSLALTIKTLYLGEPKTIVSTAALSNDPNATGSFATSSGRAGGVAGASGAEADSPWGLGKGAVADGIVRRRTPFGDVDLPGRVVDDEPQRIPPQLALVLDGKLARSAVELKSLVALSRKPEADFVKEYALQWEKAFRDGSPLERELLAYGLLSSRKYSAAVFAQMTDGSMKSTLRATAREWRTWTADPHRKKLSATIDYLGRHPTMGKELDVFLEDPAVFGYVAPSAN